MRNIIIALFLAASIFSSDVQAEPLRLSRTQVCDMALSHSEEMKKADNAVRQSELDRKIAATAYLPKFAGSATGIYMLPDIDMMGQKMQMRGAYMAGVQLVQPIYAGGKITAGRKLAGIGAEVAQQQLRLCRADPLAEADNAYWTYVAVRDKVSLMDAYVAMIDTLYNQTAVAVDAGMAVGNDLLRIEAKRSELRYQTQKAANGADLCRMALCNLIGVALDTPIVPLDTVPDCVMPLDLTPDIADRPEVRLLEKSVDAARQQVNMVRGDFLPTVGLSLGYTYYGNIKMKGMADAGGGNYVPFTQEYRDGIGMGILSVSIPLFHWGEGMKKVKRAKIDVENASLDLERNRNLMDLEARQAAINIRDCREMVSSARLALRQAEENLRVMQTRYDESMSPLTDLLDAQTQWQQAKSNLIEALTQFQIYHTAWLKANGKL